MKADYTVQECSAAVTRNQMFEPCAANLVGLNVVAATMIVAVIVGVETATGNEVVGTFAIAAVNAGCVPAIMLVKAAMFDSYYRTLDAQKSVAVNAEHHLVFPYVDAVNGELAVDPSAVAAVQQNVVLTGSACKQASEADEEQTG